MAVRSRSRGRCELSKFLSCLTFLTCPELQRSAVYYCLSLRPCSPEISQAKKAVSTLPPEIPILHKTRRVKKTRNIQPNITILRHPQSNTQQKSLFGQGYPRTKLTHKPKLNPDETPAAAGLVRLSTES